MSIKLKRIKEILNAKAYKDFSKWFGGQTGEIINGGLCIYEDDFIRWINKLHVID